MAFAVVASEYNAPYVEALVENARAELAILEPGAGVDVYHVPGSFEIPLLVKLAADRRKFDAIMAFGIILQGKTAHADLVARSVTDSLQNIALEYSVPVIHGVLLVGNERQARERCFGKKLNRGIEAARAAVSCARAVKSIS